MSELIKARAYEIYLASGCVDGRELDNWLQAEKEISDMIKKDPVIFSPLPFLLYFQFEGDLQYFVKTFGTTLFYDIINNTTLAVKNAKYSDIFRNPHNYQLILSKLPNHGTVTIDR